MFSFNKTRLFSTFIDRLKSGVDDIPKELNLNESDFLTVPHSYILDNPADIAIGVNKVKIKNGLSIFKIFDTALIKYVDNGEIIYIFYTTTVDHRAINTLSEILFDKLGSGLYDSDSDFTFKDAEKIKELATNTQDEKKSIRNVWITEKYTIVLQYVIQPLHQFALNITKKVPKIIERNSRKGTILDLFRIDLNKVLLTEEVSREVMLHESGEVNCIDYKFFLDSPVLGIFDALTIRLFGNERVFNMYTQTHLTFSSSVRSDLRKMTDLCQKVLSIYGNDVNGSLELDVHDIDSIENNEFWPGLTWHLNEVHGLYNLDNEEEKNIYSVMLSNGLNDEGFTLSVLCYNKLLEYFTAD